MRGSAIPQVGHFVLTVRRKFQEDTEIGLGFQLQLYHLKAENLNNPLHTSEYVSSTKWKWSLYSPVMVWLLKCPPQAHLLEPLVLRWCGTSDSGLAGEHG